MQLLEKEIWIRIPTARVLHPFSSPYNTAVSINSIGDASQVNREDASAKARSTLWDSQHGSLVCVYLHQRTAWGVIRISCLIFRRCLGVYLCSVFVCSQSLL